MRVLARFAFAFPIALALIGCGSSDFDEYMSFAERVSGSKTVVIYEGLPHQIWEGDLFDSEVARSIHVTIDNYKFYKEGRELAGQEAAEVIRLFTKKDNVRPWMGEKECGGFHPDFMAEWTVGEDKYRAHACFGCGEVKAIGPGMRVVVDMANGQAFERLLTKYQDKRPTSSVEGVMDFWQGFRTAETVSVHLGARHAPPGSEIVSSDGVGDRVREAKALSPGDRDLASEILIRPGSILDHTPKECPFRADYVLTWMYRSSFSAMSVCFACGELEYSSKRFDLSPSACVDLGRLLEPYAVALGKRPDSQ